MDTVTKVTTKEYDVEGRLIKETVTEARSDDSTPAQDAESPRAEPCTITFRYDGIERVVANPTITVGGWNPSRCNFNSLLTGVEVTRGGKSSNQFKNYLLDRVRP